MLRLGTDLVEEFLDLLRQFGTSLFANNMRCIIFDNIWDYNSCKPTCSCQQNPSNQQINTEVQTKVHQRSGLVARRHILKYLSYIIQWHQAVFYTNKILSDQFFLCLDLLCQSLFFQ